MGRFIDLTGQRFGRLFVLRRVENHITPKGLHITKWACICECENKVEVLGPSLRRGNTKSCGCLLKERALETHTIHGLSGTPEYDAYINARARCTNPQHPMWEYYGGRGIKFLFENFEEFLSLIGTKEEERQRRGLPPDTPLSLDRINNNGHYEPGNVRWATGEEQNVNKRANKWRRENARLKEVLDRRNKALVDLIIGSGNERPA
jgi:hypothetical protein